MTIALTLAAASPVFAANGAPVHFTPPLASARTIQVTETVFEASNVSTPGPLRRTGTMTLRLDRKGRFHVEWHDARPGFAVTTTISDGITLTDIQGGRVHTRPVARSEWPYPVMGLLNNMPGPVTAAPAMRGGRKVLVATQGDARTRNEFCFDPATHLLVRWSMLLTWNGKTTEVARTDYSGWILNAPLPASTFRASAGGAPPQR